MPLTLEERELCIENLDEEPPLQKELTYGLSYRAWQTSDETSPIKPKHSPINVPFELCRAFQKPHKKKRKSCVCSVRPSCHSQSLDPKMPLLDRSALTQSKYMDLLSIPNNYNEVKKDPCRKKKFKKPKVCCKCQVEPCPPRLVQMSIPNKRYVLQNWKDFQHVLPAEMLVRFDQILKSGDNLEPRDARYYFKQLNKKKRQEMRKLRRLCRKKKEEKKRGDEVWIKEQIQETLDAIVDFIKNEPLFMLNFQQMMTSDELLKYLGTQKVVKIRTRNTKNMYKRTIIEISDKLVKWMDAMSFFADIQPLDSKEKILEMPSLESILGEEFEEEEEEEEGEEEMEEGREIFEDEGFESDVFGVNAAGDAGDTGYEEFMATQIVDKTDVFGEGEGSIIDMLRGLDEDTLAKLIQILSQTPEDVLVTEIDGRNLPGVSYADVLEKLKEIRDGNLLEKQKIDLEERMIEWARRNEPDQIDDLLLDKIHETSAILAEFFKNVDISELRDSKRPGEGAGGPSGQPGEEEGAEAGMVVEDVMERAEDRTKVQAGKFKEIEEEDEEYIQASDREDIGGRPEGGAEGRFIEGEEVGGPRGVRGEGYERDEAAFGRDYGQGEEEEGRRDIIRDPGAEDATGFGEAEAEGARGFGGAEAEGARGYGEAEGEYGFEGAEGARGFGEAEGRRGFGEAEGGYGFEGAEGEGARGFRGAEGEGEAGYGRGEGEDYGELEARAAGYGEGEGEGGYLEGFEEEGRPLGVIGEEEEEEGLGLGEEGEEPVIAKLADELERLDSILGIIRGHKPPEVYEHAPGTICCLSLKIWAVWLLEIANNAHNWTKWIAAIIKQVRHYASIIRGDVVLPSGAKQVLYKEDWRKFVKDTEEKVIAWRQYSKHVKDLSSEIMDNFHGKKVNCCPKCLQDHLIKNVVTAHETLQALTEAINCAGYWQRCLDRIVEQTSKITEIDVETESGAADVVSLASEESYSIEIEELSHMPSTVGSQASYETVYEIEELPVVGPDYSEIEIVEFYPQKPQPSFFHEITLIGACNQPKEASIKQPSSKLLAKPTKSSLKQGKKKK